MPLIPYYILCVYNATYIIKANILYYNYLFAWLTLLLKDKIGFFSCLCPRGRSTLIYFYCFFCASDCDSPMDLKIFRAAWVLLQGNSVYSLYKCIVCKTTKVLYWSYKIGVMGLTLELKIGEHVRSRPHRMPFMLG